MLRIFAVSLLMSATLLIAEEKNPAKLAAPEGWAGETIELPPGFAPDMKWKGSEHIRFAPGMMKPASDSFFCYAFAFELQPKPDLTAVATRFKRQDILESSTEPSKVLSEQYMNITIETTAGQVHIGRIVEETPDKVALRTKPLEPETVTIKKSEIEFRSLSKISPMPAGLLNTLTKDEILDLLAYLESLGDSTHPNFRN